MDKTCSICKEEKAIGEFNKNKSSADGYKDYCRVCASEQNRRYRERHREKINEKKRADYWESKKNKKERTAKELAERTRVCSVCNTSKKITDFYKRGNGGFYNYCKSCHIKNTNDYRSKNVEQTRKTRIRNEHTRRARKSKLIDDFSEEDWCQAIDYFRSEKGATECAYCGNESVKLTQDHFIPLSKGGHYTKDNIIPVCFGCNTQKHNTNFFDWYPTKEFYSKERLAKVKKYLSQMNHDNLEPSESEMI